MNSGRVSLNACQSDKLLPRSTRPDAAGIEGPTLVAVVHTAGFGLNSVATSPHSANGHIMLRIPVPVRSQMSSSIERG